ncbi:MAG: hypothetical protein PHT20_01185 [Rhodoferax sp.]|nr:hypothetical protein [Rhodoferax sp.]
MHLTQPPRRARATKAAKRRPHQNIHTGCTTPATSPQSLKPQTPQAAHQGQADLA